MDNEQLQLTDGKATAEPTEPEPEAIRVARSNKTRIVLRDKTGMFARKPRRILSPSQIAAATTAKLTQPAADGDTTAYERIVDSMVELAADSRDPKEASARVKAAELLTKIVGLPEKQVEQQPSYTILLTPIECHYHKEVVDEAPCPALRPSFAEVTEIVTNEPTKS